MATAVVARPVARPQALARDEEVLVWPDLVFVEFISAMLFTITLRIVNRNAARTVPVQGRIPVSKATRSIMLR